MIGNDALTHMISLQAEAPMNEQGIFIGGDVPIVLRIFVEDPARSRTL
jgi:hypothetical protein